MNRLVLRALLVERGAMRFTPAGLPALDMVLKHQSQRLEAGQSRKVSAEIRAVAIGDIAQRAGSLAVGGEADFDGFVSAQRNGRGLVFHLTALANVTVPSTD